jgi:prevent-host-death family protein
MPSGITLSTMFLGVAPGKNGHSFCQVPGPRTNGTASCRTSSAAKPSLMMTNICYTTFMANVKIAYAKAHLPELLERVAQGERIVISRYNTPMAELVPAPKAEKVQRKFGTGKGKAMLIDPRALDPMTDDEAEAFLQGRY